MEVKNLWILTEERSKRHIIGKIFELTAKKLGISCFIDNIRILPILDKNGNFTSVYEIIGLKSPQIGNIFLKIVSGNGSFVDYLVFLNDDEPKIILKTRNDFHISITQYQISNVLYNNSIFCEYKRIEKIKGIILIKKKSLKKFLKVSILIKNPKYIHKKFKK